MKLGFDLDETVADLTGKLNSYLMETYSVARVEGSNDYDLRTAVYTSDAKLNAEIIADSIEKVNDPVFQAGAEPHEDAVECIRKMRKAGHSIHFITSRNVNGEFEVAKWFRKHHIPFDSIHNVGRGKEKGLIGRMLNLDFYIDDLIRHLESMIKYKKRWRKGLCLLSKEWNATPVDESRFIRLADWSQVSRHLGIHLR